MEKDSYPRFLKSNIYLNLLNDLQANSLKWVVPGWQQLKYGIKDRRNTPVALPAWSTWPALVTQQAQRKYKWLKMD